MTAAIVISVIALFVSISSLALGFYLAWRDRPNLRAKCCARTHEQTGEYSSVFVTAHNAGRRPITLRFLAGVYEDGTSGGLRLIQDGLKLQEGEFHELEFGKFDGIMVNGDDMSDLVDLFLEDSIGRKYRIEGSREAIALIQGSKHPFGVRTHG